MRLRLIAIAVLGAVVLGGAYVGRDLITSGSGGGWTHEAGDVYLAERAMSGMFDQGRPNLTFVVEAREGDVDSRPVVSAALDFIDLLEERPGIADVSSYWTLGRPDWLRSEDGSAALVTARIPGASADIARRAASVSNIVRNADDAISVTVGGEAILQADVQRSLRSTVMPLLAAAVVSLLLALWFLRNVVATALIGATAALAVALGLLGAWGVAQFREVPVLSVILGMALAWGLATASGLVVMARFIAERHAGVGRREAVGATVATAGRTVGIATAVAAATGMALWAMPTALLRSTGYTLGIAGVAAGVSTVIGLGVLLAIVGVQVIRSGSGASAAGKAKPLDRVSRAARARPALTALLLVAVLGPLVFVATGVQTGEPTPISMASGSQSRRVAQVVSSTFAADEAAAPFVVARSVVDIPGAKDLTIAYAAELSRIDGVLRVDSAEGSFVDGAPIDVPREIPRQFRGEEATWFNVPVEGNPTGRVAMEATRAMIDAEAPYRVTVAGPAAREKATVAAIDGRLPYLVGLIVIASALLVAWLLRSVNAALRFVVMMILMTAAVGVVIRFGFAEGILAGLLGFSRGGAPPAVGPPIAWALSAVLAATLLVFGWGSVREFFDAKPDNTRASTIALAATARVHVEAAALLLVPFVPLLFTSWSTAKLIGASALATVVLTATVGRFVALPAFTGFAERRLWPIDLEGKPHRVYATTPALLRAIEDVEAREAAAAQAAPTDEEAERQDIGAIAGDEEEPPPDEPTSAPVVPHDAIDEVAPPPAHNEGAPTQEPAPVLSGDAEADAASRTEEASLPVAAVADDGDTTSGGLALVADVELPAEDSTPAAAPMPEAPPHVDEPVEVAPAPATRGAELDDEVVGDDADERVGAGAAQLPAEEPAEEPVAVELVVSEAVVAESVDLVGAPAAENVEEPVAAAALGDDEPPVAEEAASLEEAAPVQEAAAGAEGATVDVASLTASVIAALESRVPFTTEIGEAFVANPANNLSRVMEAILRDASQRGGDEVLVYGHASRDRYRWMVVDSGPSSDIDPERARTLAEAQRFIRRVGGVVDCRPQGEFTVFVVEIPMAS